MSLDPIEAGLRASENFLAEVDKLIKAQIINSWPDRIPGIDFIARQLETRVAASLSILRKAESEIKTQIEPLLAKAIPGALDVVGNLTRVLDENLQALISNIASTEDVIAVVTQGLRSHSPQLAKWFADHVAGALGNTALGVMEVLEHESPHAFDPILDELLALDVLPDWMRAGVESARGRHAPVFAFILPALILAALLPVLGALGEPIVTAARQGAFATTPTKVAEPGTLLDAVIRKSITRDHFLGEMRKSGYDQNVADLMYINRAQLLDPETITRAYIRGNVSQEVWQQELEHRGIDHSRAHTFWQSQISILGEMDAREAYLRGFVDAQKHDGMLAHLGYQADAAELRRQLYFYIPPPADLIHMGIRNVFTPEIVERFQLDHDKPDAFVKAAHQQGISDDWAGKYWQAHWIMPGREAFFEMFQRTVDKPLDPNADTITLSDGTRVYNIMGRDTLNLALRDVDTPPFYRDKLTEIAYHPLTRVDIRRLAAMGLLTHAQIERAYLDLGYNQTRARQLADFTDALTARTRKDATTQLTDGVRKQVLRLYTQEKIDDKAARTALEDMGATDAEISVYLAESDIVRDAEDAVAHETGIGKLYINGLISDKEATKRMQTVGIPVNAMSRLFSKWDLEVEYRGGTSHIHAHKELTKSEVLTALTDGLLAKETADRMLEDMGYDKDSAQAEISLALYKAAKATKTAQVDAIKASFTNGTIDTLDASNRLDALYIPAEQRDAYLATWGLQRETRTERIPLATLRDMVAGGFISEGETLEHLRRHRFTETDAQLMLRYWSNRQANRRSSNVPSA